MALQPVRGPPWLEREGLVASIILVGVGVILDWAVTEPYQHGLNVNKGLDTDDCRHRRSCPVHHRDGCGQRRAGDCREQG
jgi:hypothetical protein